MQKGDKCYVGNQGKVRVAIVESVGPKRVTIHWLNTVRAMVRTVGVVDSLAAWVAGDTSKYAVPVAACSQEEQEFMNPEPRIGKVRVFVVQKAVSQPQMKGATMTTKLTSMGVVLLMVFAVSGWAQAESYVAAQLGFSMPHDASSVESGGVTSSDLALKNSVLYGGKVGHYFSEQGYSWLGVETEVFATHPSVKQQGARLCGGGACANVQLQETSASVVTWAINALVRYPGERWQPYAGLGLGVFFASLDGDGSSTTPGLNALVGLRYKIDERFGIFTEWKHTDAHLSFDTTKAHYSAEAIVFGASVHF